MAAQFQASESAGRQLKSDGRARNEAASHVSVSEPSDGARQSSVQKSRVIKTTTTTTTTETKRENKENLESSVAVVEDLGRQAASSTVGQQQQQQRARARLEPAAEAIDFGRLGVDGNRFVTTIGTIVAQANRTDCRIVVGILKDGDELQLKVQEMRPGMFEVGANHQECLRHFEEHQKIISNLNKQRQAPLDCWLGKYQKIQQLEPQMSNEMKLVYMCMAENLQGCWRALLGQLEQRLRLLNETCKFYETTERLKKRLDEADQHVQRTRQELLDGPGTLKFQQALAELKRLNQLVVAEHSEARQRQAQLVQLIGQVATGNLGDFRVNQLIADGQSLMNYISSYLEPLERRKIQLENVIKTTSRTVTTTSTTTTTGGATNNPYDRSRLNSVQQFASKSNRVNQLQTAAAPVAPQPHLNGNVKTSSASAHVFIREINSFNDLNLAENWLNIKVDQLNSSLLSSLGIGAQDSRSILTKHEQIALECSAIEEATLTFNGKNIHALRSIEPKDDKLAGDKSLFEHQKQLASRVRDVITILDARIILLRRTIDFYSRAKEATCDISKMMRRLQVDNSLQSVQYVANELELKDVSSVVASGATIISELQQLQLAQKHGQRSSIVNLNLITSGIRSIIDQLNQDLAHLKTVLNQRKLVLLNEDATKMAQNFSNKCRQLQAWLDGQAKAYLLANNRAGDEPSQVRPLLEGHEQLRLAIQNKTPEVEALLRLLTTTLTESFDAKSQVASDIQRDTDELRQDWIQVTNCLDRRLELLKKYLAILNLVDQLNRELDTIDPAAKGESKRTPDERTDEDVQASVGQLLAQLGNQVKNFTIESKTTDTTFNHSPDDTAQVAQQKPPTDINKDQLVDHANDLLEFATKRRNSILERRNQHPTQRAPSTRTSRSVKSTVVTQTTTTEQSDISRQIAPSFTKQLIDRNVEPFSLVELECEFDPGNCSLADGSAAQVPGRRQSTGSDFRIDWLFNNNKKIPANLRHSIQQLDGGRHRLVINQFNPSGCGIYTARAVDKATNQVVASTSCRLRLAGIKETTDDAELEQKQQQPPESSKTSQATKRQMTSQSASPAGITSSTSSSFSQWRPINDRPNKWQQQQQQAMTSNKERALERIIRGVESSPTRDSVTRTVTINVTNTDETSGGRLPVTQASYNGQSSAAGQPLPRLNYIDSPSANSLSSSTNLSRSVSKSPFEGTPTAPVFTQNLSNALEGRSCSRAGLVCVVVGNPPPTIEWLHNSRPIATAKCSRPDTADGNVCKLTIETVNDRTRGQYVCRASNRLGQTTSQTFSLINDKNRSS